MPLDMEIIADQISRAFRGESWHGPSVREVLAGVSAEDAAAHPIAGAHSIWEIVLHLTGWIHSGSSAGSWRACAALAGGRVASSAGV